MRHDPKSNFNRFVHHCFMIKVLFPSDTIGIFISRPVRHTVFFFFSLMLSQILIRTNQQKFCHLDHMGALHILCRKFCAQLILILLRLCNQKRHPISSETIQNFQKILSFICKHLKKKKLRKTQFPNIIYILI